MIEMNISLTDSIQAEVKEYMEVSTDDYEKLRNKPKLNGKTITGDMNETDPTVPGWAKASQKPVYIANEVGAVPTDNIITLDEIDALFKGL